MYCPNCEFEIKQDVIECPICGGELTELAEEGADTHADSAGSEETDTGSEKAHDTCISDLILDAKHELDSFESKPDSEPQPIEPLSNSLDFESMLSEETAETTDSTDEPPLSIEAEILKTIPAEPQEKEDIFSLDDTTMPFQASAPLENEPPAEQESQFENLFADDNLFINKEAVPPAAPDTSPFIPEKDMPLENDPPAEQESQSENLFTDDNLFINEAAVPPAAPDTSPFIAEMDMALENKPPAEQESQPENLFADDNLFINEAAVPPAGHDTSPFIPEMDMPLESKPPAEQESQPENLFADDNLFINEAAVPPAAPDTNTFLDEVTAKRSDINPPEEQSSDLPWSLDELSALDPIESTTAGSEAQTEQADDMAQRSADFIEIADAEPTTKEEEQADSAGPRSKKRLIFLILFGILIIGGAYILQEYLPQLSGPDQIQKPSRIRPSAALKKTTPPEPFSEKPSAALTEETAPAEDLAEGLGQQTAASQPESSKTEAIPAETPTKATGQEQSVIPIKEPEPPTEPIINTRKTVDVPDMEQAPSQLKYTIHVASSKRQQASEQEVKRLQSLGFDAYLSTVDLGAKGIWHRIKVGHYATRTEAEQVVIKIKQKNPGIKPLINRTQ